MRGPQCPADGCDYNADGEKSKQSVRRHINAKSGDAHSDTEALRKALNRAESTAEEGGEGAPDDTDDEEQGEAAEEGAEAAENRETEQDEMDQSEEYEQQVADAQGDESTDERTGTEGQQGGDTGTTTTAQGGGWGVPSGPFAVGLVLVVVVALLLAATSGDDDREPKQVDSTVESDTEVSSVDESDPYTPNVEAWA